MMILITGGAASGKSLYAEDLICARCPNPTYIATMRPFGEEAHERIQRHRLQRAGRGFSTIECFTDIGHAEASGCALLEDVSNLLANEMFEVGFSGAAERTANGILALNKRLELLVAVTNEIFSDGIKYPPETEEYIKNLAEVNIALAAEADKVIEIICGIPVFIKE